MFTGFWQSTIVQMCNDTDVLILTLLDFKELI